MNTFRKLLSLFKKSQEKTASHHARKRNAEKRFFPVEWYKSPEARIIKSFEDYDEGLQFAFSLLKKSYGISKSKKTLSKTAEVLAMANILKRIGVTRETIQGIFPHPRKEGVVLVEKKDGCVFEIFSKNKIGCKRIDSKNPLLDFWHADDDILFPEEDVFYL